MKPESYDPLESPTLTADQVRTRLASDLSLAKRIMYTVLLLVNAAAAVLLLMIWLPDAGGLPLRTHAAFAGCLSVTIAWVVFGAWVLTRRRPLYAYDRVLAARLAVAFTGLFTVSGASIAVFGVGVPQAVVTLAGGGLLFGVSWFLLVNARRERGRLLKLREHLAASA